MKPAPFSYQAPESLPAALDALAEAGWDAKLLAGGQSLLPVMNFRLAQPAQLIDLNRLQELDFVRETPEGGLRLGALVRLRALERDPRVARACPLLAQTVPHIAHPQIRNRGTVGGSLAHADPAAELPTVMVASGARFRLQKRTGDRWVQAGDFYLGLFDTALEADEILTEIEIPPTPASTRTAFAEVARRHGDYAQVGLATRVDFDPEGRCREARLVFLSVGDTPMVARGAADRLRGRVLDAATIDEAARLAAQEIQPADDIHATAAFKRHLAAVLTRRTLAEVAP